MKKISIIVENEEKPLKTKDWNKLQKHLLQIKNQFGVAVTLQIV